MFDLNLKRERERGGGSERQPSHPHPHPVWVLSPGPIPTPYLVPSFPWPIAKMLSKSFSFGASAFFFFCLLSTISQRLLCLRSRKTNCPPRVPPPTLECASIAPAKAKWNRLDSQPKLWPYNHVALGQSNWVSIEYNWKTLLDPRGWDPKRVSPFRGRVSSRVESSSVEGS